MQCWLFTAVSDIVPFAILWGFWTKWWLLGSISFQCLPWVQHYSSFSFTVNWSGWSSASLTRGLQRGHFIILRYLALKILCKDYSIALVLLSICWKYVKCLCLKGATSRAESILFTLDWEWCNWPWATREGIMQCRGIQS